MRVVLIVIMSMLMSCRSLSKFSRICGPDTPIMSLSMQSTQAPSPPSSSLTHLRVASWNVNGIRALYRHDPSGDAIRSLFDKYRPDVLCLQETKIQEQHVEEVREEFFRIHADLDPVESFWSCSTARKGYSGTATILFGGDKFKPGDVIVKYGIGCEDGDVEGRSITLLHEAFSLTNVYVPNSGAALKRLDYRTEQWDVHLSSYMAGLQSAHPDRRAILTGDLNVAHQAIDYHNPHAAATRKQSGTTPQEQASFFDKYLRGGDGAAAAAAGYGVEDNRRPPLLVDTYRRLHPTGDKYSFFSARRGDGGRERHEGLRIDYVLTNDHSIHSADRGHEAFVEEGILHPYSDHCPVGASVRLFP